MKMSRQTLLTTFIHRNVVYCGHLLFFGDTFERMTTCFNKSMASLKINLNCSSTNHISGTLHFYFVEIESGQFIDKLDALIV